MWHCHSYYCDRSGIGYYFDSLQELYSCRLSFGIIHTTQIVIIMRKRRGVVMGRTFLRRLSVILMILMLATAFSFAGSESDQNPESGTSYGFEPYQADAAQLSDAQKKAIEKGITRSSKK